MSIPLTQKQPAHWPRKRIGDCFSIVTGVSGPLSFQAGDIQIKMREGKMVATLIEEDQTQTQKGVGRMRGNGTLMPQLMVAMINHPNIQQSMRHFAESRGSVVFMVNISSLRDIEIGVPDPQTQAMMVRTIDQSHRFLNEHTALVRHQADTLDRMGDAILHQVLIGQADRKEALTWVWKALSPLSRLADFKDGVAELSPQEAGQADPEARFVRAEDHRNEVAKLSARIRELEAQAPATQAKPRSPGF